MSGFDPNQPRDTEGRWTELAGLMRTSGGFTSLASGERATSGFSVGVSSKDGKDHRTLPHGSTTAADIAQFTKDFQAELGLPNRGVGGWSNANPDYDGGVRDALDIVEVFNDMEAAMKAARAAGQDSFYDLGKDEEIPVPKRKGTKMKDLSVYTPTLKGTYDLSFRDGKLAFWKQILPRKVIHYTAKDGTRQTLDFNEQYLADLATARGPDKVGFLLADADNRHTMDPERWRGEVEEFEVREDGLYGKIVFPNREAAKAVLDNPDLGVSARIREGIEKSDGSSIARGIIHVLGTLDPQVGGMSGWQTADLSTEAGNLLDLTAETYEDGTTMTDTIDTPAEFVLPTEAEIDAMSEEELDVFLAAAKVEFDGILDEDEDEDTVTPEPEKVPEMALSTEAQQDIDLARSDARAARTELAQAKWDRARDRYLSEGVPPALLDLAEPIFNRPTDFVVDLSNEGGEEIHVGEIVAKFLDAAKGTIDLSAEEGHSGTFRSGDGEDPDKTLLDLWESQA